MNPRNRFVRIALVAVSAAALTACGASDDAESGDAASGSTASGSTAASESSTPPTTSGYADLLDADIRGLDAETVEGYLTGKGLGYALPAELNGYPGPRHVLDAPDELELTDEQHAQIQELFDEMQADAIALGEQIVAAEAELEAAFRSGEIDDDTLRGRLDAIGVLDAELRFVHLSTHLATIDMLTEHQVVLYNEVRGYDDTDEGHGDTPEGHEQHQGG
jgi:Spy/CpxP family protein refolding chaperone